LKLAGLKELQRGRMFKMNVETLPIPVPKLSRERLIQLLAEYFRICGVDEDRPPEYFDLSYERGILHARDITRDDGHVFVGLASDGIKFEGRKEDFWNKKRELEGYARFHHEIRKDGVWGFHYSRRTD